MNRCVSSVGVSALLMIASFACGSGGGGEVSTALTQTTEGGDPNGSTRAGSGSTPTPTTPPTSEPPEPEPEPEPEPHEQLTNNHHSDSGAIWSPDGSRIAFLSEGGNSFGAELVIMDVDGTNAQQITDNIIEGDDFYSTYISWSPDSSHILIVFKYNDLDDLTSLGYNLKMYVVNVDSLALMQLADRDNFGGGASWSPDGTKILFQSGAYEEADEDSEIFVMDADGSNIRQLTANDRYDGGASWSPDGTKILFQSGFPFPYEEADEDSEIFVMDADGSNIRQLTANDRYDGEAGWSPDGSLIIYVSTPTEFEGFENGDSFEDVNSDGSTCIIKLNGSVVDCYSQVWIRVWSPDGSRILYRGITDEEVSHVSVMNVDGSGGQDLFSDGERNQPLGWSPDGSQVIISSDSDGDEEIFAVNADGSNVRQLTNNDSYDGEASWSPDGSLILFSSDRDGDKEIFVMDAP